jgi:hypothetical protein
MAEAAPHVLDFKAELVVDGRLFERPVNYCLVRIVPPPGIEIDMRQRPFVIVDPRAGHGPGIGGFKADSEIGVALKAGHPCYFIGFLPSQCLDKRSRMSPAPKAYFWKKSWNCILKPKTNRV